MLGRWNPISQTILEWQWIVLHWIEHLPWNDIWNPVVTKTEQTHYGPWQSQYHTVQPKGPPNAGPWKLTQWSPQTVANAWRDAAFIFSAISLAISLVMTGMMSMTRSDIFSNVLGDSLRSVRNIFSAIDSQDLVTIAWANLPRELYNVKIRKGVVFKGLGFQQALGLGPSPGSGKPNQTTQLLALALVSLRIQQPILRSIGVNFKHGGCISQWKAWKMSGFATQTPSSQQVFGAAFRLQSLEIQNCHTVTSPGSHWVVLEPHQAHPNYHQPYPHHHRTRAGPNNSMVSSFFYLFWALTYAWTGGAVSTIFAEISWCLSQTFPFKTPTYFCREVMVWKCHGLSSASSMISVQTSFKHGALD